MGSAVEIALLGEVSARVGGRDVELGPARQRCVLAALAVDVNQVVSVALLTERVWGADPPARSRATLHSYLSRLRQALAGAEVELAGRGGGYVLVVDEGAVDLTRFRRLRDEARRLGDDEAAVRVLATIILTQQTTATPEQFVAGLTDFGPGRATLFPNSADDALVVHSQSETSADVTEGSGGIWERLHYDWSDLSHVVLTTVDSNVWGGRSGHTYTFTKQADGTTVVHAEVVREGKNFKGGLLGLTLGLFGKKVLGGALARTVAAIETRVRNS